MLTVWSLCWGDKYDDYSVQRLQREVGRYLDVPHQFKCITDRQIEGVECVPPINDLPGWWGKTNLFSWDVMAEQNFYLDLDVVITSNLDEMVMEYSRATCAMPNNWAASGHGGCQSSVMLWTKNHNVRQIHDLFDPAIAHWPPINQPPILWGDQEWVTKLRDADKVQVRPITEGIYSYKYHVRGQALPDAAKIIVFHGSPKPSDVPGESWFQW